MPDAIRSPSTSGADTERWTRRRVSSSLPGATGTSLLDALAASECPAITARRARRAGETGVPQDPIVWHAGRGAVIEDVDGNRYLDFTAAFAVSGYGHSHPELVAALSEQAARLMHGMGDVYPTDAKIAFARRLSEFVPGRLEQSIFGLSGADAVEAALKTAFLFTGRRRVLAFQGGYHGLSVGALPVTAYRNSFREPFSGRCSTQVTHLPYPDCERCPFGLRRESCGLACLEHVRRVVRHPASGCEDLGAIIVEPVQGRGGYVVPPAEFLPGLSELCVEQGLVLIVDEIYTGFGRTGRHFAFEHFLSADAAGPDVVCLGKAMTGGFPMSACVGTAEVMAAWGSSRGEAIHTSTFLGNPMGCAVGLKALELLERERYAEVAAARGAQLRAGLERLRERFPERLGALRGLGLMVGIEIVRDAQTREPDGGTCLRIMRAMLERGVLVLPSGVWGQVLAFSPPFVISPEEIDEMLGVLEEVLGEVFGG